VGIALEARDDAQLIRLEGSIDINCAAELKGVLVSTLGAGRKTGVTLEDVTYLDVTAIQLLRAAEREAGNCGAAFTFEGQLAAEVLTDLTLAGFDKSCFAEAANSEG
jgi:anti-anti-sigma factor